MASDVPAQSVRSFSFDDLDTREAYAGEITLTIPADTFGQSIDKVQLFVDGEFQYEDGSPPFRIRIHTYSYLEGPHEILVGVKLRGQPSGVLEMVNGIPTLYVDTLVFDRSAPSEMSSSVTLQGDTARVTWERPADANLAGYIVRGRYDPTLSVLDTLWDPTATEYIDPDVTPIYGYPVTYQVDAFNGVTDTPGMPSRAAFANERRFTLPGAADQQWVTEFMRVTPDGEGFVSVRADTLQVHATRSLNQTVSVPTSSLVESNYQLHRVFFGPEGRRVFARQRYGLVRNRPLPGAVQLDPESFERLATPTLPVGHPDTIANRFFAAGDDGRVFTVTAGQRLTVYDADTGNIRGTLQLPSGEDAEAYSPLLSRDGRTLYFVQKRKEGDQIAHYLYAVDVAGDTLQVQASVEARFPDGDGTPSPYFSARVPRSPDLYVVDARSGINAVYRFEAETLRNLGRVQLPDQAALLATTEEHHYLEEYGYSFRGYRTMQYGADLSTKVREWQTRGPFAGVTPDDQFIFFHYDGYVWALPTTR